MSASGSPVFLMSYPTVDWAPVAKANFISREASSAVPPGEALRDWLTLARAIEEAGGAVWVMPPPSGRKMTGLPYTAEAGHLVWQGSRPLYLLPNLTPPHRIEESLYVEGFLRGVGWEVVSVRNKWEGQGDVLCLDEKTTVHTYGRGDWARTSPEAFFEIGRWFPGALHLGFRADPWFHGNTFLGFFRSTRGEPVGLVCREALLPGEWDRLKAFLTGVRLVEIGISESRAYATNALQVNEVVLAPAGLSPLVTSLWKEIGLGIRELPFSALFQKGGGAGVCLTNRLWNFPAAEIPESFRLVAWERRLASDMERA